ncbi:MAG: putative selenium-dependent hydroxylase accessory protein YqeC [Lachnospiraceae bacterium]|nr:putative selenium-dependent hydroxylase accessory protein YqeC [Lachnospiraceae bacterium]
MYRSIRELHIPRGAVSVIGSGGKTTFLRCLSEHLHGRVILTTSTRIFPFSGMPLIDPSVFRSADPGPDEGPNHTPACDPEAVCQEILSAFEHSRVICFGCAHLSGKLGDPSPFIPFEKLTALADHVLIEADGSAGHPLKAHRPWEPVIPDCSSLTICLVGASGIGALPEKACHCPDLFMALADMSGNDPVTNEHIAQVLKKEDLADCYLINQVDTLRDPKAALRLCELIEKPAYAGSLRSGQFL